MISIIICSRSNEISSLTKNIQETIGCEYELIVIDNSKNKYDIFAAYNLGVEKSKFKILCFLHEDVEFITQNWGLKITQHLTLPNVGLIGLAGGKGALRVPYGWTSFSPVVNIIHSLTDKNNLRVDIRELSRINGDLKPESVVLLDGVFLCTNKSFFDECAFDEKIGGFHGYDLDISMSSFNEGFTNYVIFDVDLRHYSKGIFGVDYINALLKVYQKWEPKLPFIDRTCDLSLEMMYKLEKKTLLRLKKRLVRSGMKFCEIKPIIEKYRLQTGNSANKLTLIALDIQLFFIKEISTLRKLMISQN